MHFDPSFSCLSSPKRDAYRSIWRKDVSRNSEETKYYQSNFAPRSAIHIRRVRTVCQRIFKHRSHHKLTVWAQRAIEEMGASCIGSHRPDPLQPIIEHKRISPHINLSFPPLKRKQDASARLSIGLIPRLIPLQDTKSPQPTHPHFKAALGKKDFNPGLRVLELIKKEVIAPLQQSSCCWCYYHIVVVTSGIVHRSLWNSKLWVKFGNQQQGLLAGIR